ncbi:hypothetical protein [Sphingomonas sp. CARO-RG-8B-R24-01]|uniref:hypothetical protein n=1 Tax=Sphingomonas sp. CARO-RG-8B-R24-01 TaxID=2914831 RepID=UPI001F586779|nr:hypothetical protein [Sphingomonas sp. CARO-RG-8B-R24-01]
MDKQKVRETMLQLEEAAYDASRQSYLQYISAARLDRTEPIENDEQAQAEFARDLSEAFDQPIHAHSEKLEKLRRIDFAPKRAVDEGAIVKVAGRYFVIAVASDKFTCEGHELMGISTEAPIYQVMAGKGAGDSCSFNGRTLIVESVE